MLTPKDLRDHEFPMAGRNAYRAADVDEYMDEVFSSYDQMFRENAEIVRKLQVLADRLQKYKDDEENIRNALVEAQRMKNSIIVEAQQKAQGQLTETEEKIRAARESVDAKAGEIIDKANVQAEDILKDARAEAAEIIERAHKKATDLLDTANAIYEDKVGSVEEEAAKESAYLKKIKIESARIRKQLADTYQMQMELLSFAPDFSDELKTQEPLDGSEEEPTVEEELLSGEKIMGERAYKEAQEARAKLDKILKDGEEVPEIPEAPSEEEAAPEEAPVEEELPKEEAAEEPVPVVEEDDDDGFGNIDQYLAADAEEAAGGNKYFRS